MATTRFNPSVNGPLHLGHAYIALLNEALAHSSGGRFVVRWADGAQPSAQAQQVVAQQRVDLEWLELTVDVWSYESVLAPLCTAELQQQGVVLEPEPPAVVTPRCLVAGQAIAYPFTPTLTAYKVLLDQMQGVDMLVRGLDLMTEYSLYAYYCRLLGVPNPQHVYVPRLLGPRGDISKTQGGYTLAELRGAGYTPGQVRDLLGKACLQWYMNGWTLDNLRTEPRL